MKAAEFRKRAHEAVDWVADYLENIESYTVKSDVPPKWVYDKLPDKPPENEESPDQIFEDLNTIIIPGITHWQHPNFHAYFPANNSYPSIIGEILTAGIGAQCMVWETSPAAAELEEKMMEWLKSLMQLPKNWQGVIQDTASTATLTAILTAREKASAFTTNSAGIHSQVFRVYCSEETHSSIEKAVKIAGIGADNLVKISVNNELALESLKLQDAIESDLKQGFIPCCVISTLGTTGTLAFDPVQEIGSICKAYNLWHHIDAAYAGSALVLPEMDWMREGLNTADSFVFNPHKWLFTNFDCSAYYVKDKEALIKTFEILPEYLKTSSRGAVNDYRDWGIPLGRRFRALKLWFVLRSFGVNGIQSTIRNHIDLGRWFADKIVAHENLELVTPPKLNMVVFSYIKGNFENEKLNTINEWLLHQINASGKAYLTHTKIKGRYAIRFVCGQTYVEKRHIENLWSLIEDLLKMDVDKIKK